MPSQSLFDINTFLDTHHKVDIDAPFVLPDAGDYPAQITDTQRTPGINVISGVGDDGRPYAILNVQWELQDETIKAKLNTERVFARQSFFLDLTEDTPPQLDFGTNKNMRLRSLWKATGCKPNSKGQINIGMLKFQTGYVHVENMPARGPNADPDMLFPTVTRVTSADKARANGAV